MRQVSLLTSIGGIMVLLAHTASTLAEDTISPADALQRARRAIGYDVLGRQSGDLLIEGTADHLGITGPFRLLISPNGEFLQTVEGHGTHGLGFDGKVLWERAFSWKPQVLDFGDNEMYRAFMAVRTYRWLAANSPYSIKAGQAAENDGEICFVLEGPSDVTPTELILDRRSWLPIRASRHGLFGDLTWEFNDYGEFHGMKWPRKSTLRHGKAVEEFRVSTLQFNQRIASTTFGLPQVMSHVSWDTKLPSRVELKRTPSGHFFVKAKANGHDVGWFALDTGTGSGMTISRKAADQLRLTAFGKTFAGGASHQVETQFREAESFQVGPAIMRPAVLYELPPSFTDAMSALFGFEWAGTIGHNFLSQVVAELNLSAIALELRNPANYELKQGEWHPIRLNHGIPCLKAKVDGRHEDWFQLDTGAGALAIIHSPAVEKLQLLNNRDTRKQPLQGVGGSIDAQRGTLREFTVAGQTFSNVPTFFVTGKQGALTDPYVMGTFGAGILGGYKLIFDYGNRRVALVR